MSDRPAAIISDLHLGGGPSSPRDTSMAARRPKWIERMLDWFADQNADLYLAGDILELHANHLESIVRAHTRLLDRLGEQVTRYVAGNHDRHFLGLPSMWNPPHPLLRTYGGPVFRQVGPATVVICHGDEGDPYCSGTQPGLDVITAVYSARRQDSGRVQYADDAISRLHRWDRWIHRLRRKRSPAEEQRVSMDKMCEFYRASMVVCGHTHTPGSWGLRERGTWRSFRGLNCGCLNRDRDTFVFIDSSGSGHVLEWVESGPVEVEDILG